MSESMQIVYNSKSFAHGDLLRKYVSVFFQGKKW